MSIPVAATDHPRDTLLRSERFPHIWCPGCGLGIVLRSYAEAVGASKTPTEKHITVSGIGCTGRSAGYMNLDSYHTTHGRAIPFATGMKLANHDLKVAVISGDGDLTTIGGNHLIHAARRNVDITVLLVNNFNYGMTGGQFGATTPHAARTTTSPYGNYESPFNIPHIVAACGAPYVARWTTLHIRQLRQAIDRAFEVEGFSLVEIISPCPQGYGKKNGYAEAMKEMGHFMRHAIVDHDADLSKVGITMAQGDAIVVGDFVDEKRPSYTAGRQEVLARRRGGIQVRTEIRIAGSGGQGVITLGMIIARAAVLHDRTNAVLTEDYGPEKTGGWSRADVVVSRDEIGYPLVEHPDVLVALSQDGYLRFRKTPKPGALVLIDPDMVRPTDDEDAAVPLRIPARREGEALGARVLANLIMVGAVVELTRVVTPESALKAIARSTRADATNGQAAFERGRVLARGVTA